MGGSQERPGPVKLVFTEPAIKDLTGLEANIRERVKAGLDRILINPEAADLRKIKSKPGIWRLRVGDLRVFLKPSWIERVIYILRIKHRRDAYR
jgi:mRNA interferase RelE/StbE